MTAWKDKIVNSHHFNKADSRDLVPVTKIRTPPLTRALDHDWDNHTVHRTKLPARNTVALLVFLCSFLFPKIIRYYLGKETSLKASSADKGIYSRPFVKK